MIKKCGAGRAIQRAQQSDLYVITDENYEVAWKTLTSHCSNQRLMVYTLLYRLIQQTTITSDCCSVLRKLHDVYRDSRPFKSISRAGIALDILLKKLDRATFIRTNRGLVNYISKPPYTKKPSRDKFHVLRGSKTLQVPTIRLHSVLLAAALIKIVNQKK